LAPRTSLHTAYDNNKHGWRCDPWHKPYSVIIPRIS